MEKKQSNKQEINNTTSHSERNGVERRIPTDTEGQRDSSASPQNDFEMPQPRKHLPKWLLIIVIIGVLIVFGVSGWIVYNKFFVPRSQPEQKEEGQKEPFTDWQVYRNEEYGYEVRYLVDWEAGEDIEILGHRVYGASKTTVFVYKDYEAQIFITTPPPEIGYEAWERKDEAKSILNKEGINFEKIYLEHIYSDSDMILTGWSGETWEKEGQIRLSYKRQDKEKVEEIFDRILSTFKFIEPDETAGWETYKNEEYSFSIKYPRELKISKRENEFWGSYSGQSVNLTIKVVPNQSFLILHPSFTGVDCHSSELSAEVYDEYECLNGTQRFVYFPLKDPYEDLLIEIFAEISFDNTDENLDKMLSTFKFVEPDETAGWETFKFTQ